MRRVPALTLALATLALTGCGIFRGTSDTATPHAQVTLRVANAALTSGAPDVALRVAQLVLETQPNNPGALAAKADALYALGAADQARATYQAAVAADAGNVGAQIGLGRTLVRSDPKAAEEHFRAAAAVQPDNIIALNNLGIACDMQGRHAEAQQAYRQALAVAPDAADVKTNLGLSLALSEQGTQAVQAAAQARDRGPSGPVLERSMQAATARFDPTPANQVVGVEGIYIQLASLDSEEAAQAQWQQMRSRWSDLLLGREPTLVPSHDGDRTYWRLRTGGFPSAAAAGEFCRRLRAAGATCRTVEAVPGG